MESFTFIQITWLPIWLRMKNSKYLGKRCGPPCSGCTFLFSKMILSILHCFRQPCTIIMHFLPVADTMDCFTQHPTHSLLVSFSRGKRLEIYHKGINLQCFLYALDVVHVLLIRCIRFLFGTKLQGGVRRQGQNSAGKNSGAGYWSQQMWG